MAERAATLSVQVVSALRKAGLVVSTAESCTGGWIAKQLTDIPGSSAVFDSGLVCYSNAAKQTLLDVDPAAIADHGSVSEQVVRAMAQGALMHAKSDLAVAVSGVAGPDGGSELKPVGTVWFALAKRGSVTMTRCEYLPGGREEVRLGAVIISLEMILQAVT
jgi:nicotinamide-nucleotide amidase